MDGSDVKDEGTLEMSLLEMRKDLCTQKRVSRSRVTYDINYDQEVIYTQEGWNDGQKTVWDNEIGVVLADALTKHGKAQEK
jgi:hypothetical protein